MIGIQYYFLGLFSVFIGMTLSLLMRFHMVNPEAKVSVVRKVWPTAAAGGMMTPELYLSLMTMHGTIMVFFVLTTVPQSGFGNYFLPIQIGAEDMAFPVLNMMSFWTTFIALVVMVAAFFVQGGAPLVRLDRVSAAERRRPHHRSRARVWARRSGSPVSRSSAALP